MKQVILYNEGIPEVLDIEEVSAYLRERLGKMPVKMVGNPFHFSSECHGYAERLASLKIQDMRREITPEEIPPLQGEIEYERKRIKGKTKAFGVLYDGFHLQKVFAQLIAGGGEVFEDSHILLTNRLFATWDENDRRYHARTGVYGFPSIISTTGLVEAPARQMEYYLLKQQYELVGKDLLELKGMFKGCFIDYEDERLTEVVKGYAMQAVFYSLTGNPFCDDRGCRLYNAHWQSELMFAQLESGYEFCDTHNAALENLAGKYS